MQEEKETAIMMAALSTLTPTQLTDLTNSILSQTLLHHHRLFSLLSSPPHFSLTLHHLHSLSLSSKTILISKFLLSSLHHLTLYFHHHHQKPPLSHPFNSINHRDLDTALLLLLLCSTHQENPEILDKTPQTQWREVLRERFYGAIWKETGAIGVQYGGVLFPYLEMVIRCRRFVNVMGGGGGKGEMEVAASPAAVVALPDVEVGEEELVECVICKDGMKEGRSVCELPCGHLFHWKCVLPWFKRRNTCPCCRFRLPSEDLFGEIQRLWAVLVKVGGEILQDEHCSS